MSVGRNFGPREVGRTLGDPRRTHPFRRNPPKDVRGARVAKKGDGRSYPGTQRRWSGSVGRRDNRENPLKALSLSVDEVSEPVMSERPCRGLRSPCPLGRNPLRVVRDAGSPKKRRRRELKGDSGTTNGYGWTPRLKGALPEDALYVRVTKFRTPECRANPVRTPEDSTLSEKNPPRIIRDTTTTKNADGRNFRGSGTPGGYGGTSGQK